MTGAMRAALVVVLAAAGQGSSNVWTVPRPDTGEMLPRVARLIDEARAGVQRAAGSAEAWGRYGQVCDAHRLFAEAEVCYRRAAALAPKDFRWAYLLAVVREARGAPGLEICDLYRQALQLDPGYPAVHYRLGEILLEQGRPQEARDAFAGAVALDPSLAVAHRGLAQAMLALGDPQQALEHLQEARRLGPEDRAVHAAMAQAYMRLGRPDLAAGAAARARRATVLRSVPDPVRSQVEALGMSPQHCIDRAAAMMDKGDYAGVVENLSIVAEVEPDNAEVHLHLGMAYAAMDRPDDAIRHLAMARRNAPDDIEITMQLAAALAGRGDVDEAVDLFADAALLAPGDPRTHANLGAALAQRGDTEAAIEHFREALRVDPGFAFAHYNLGLALEGIGRDDEAAAHYRRVLQIEPDHPDAQRLVRLTR